MEGGVRGALRGSAGLEDGLRSAQLAPAEDVTSCPLASKATIRLGILGTRETGRTPRERRVSLVESGGA